MLEKMSIFGSVKIVGLPMPPRSSALPSTPCGTSGFLGLGFLSYIRFVKFPFSSTIYVKSLFKVTASYARSIQFSRIAKHSNSISQWSPTKCIKGSPRRCLSVTNTFQDQYVYSYRVYPLWSILPDQYVPYGNIPGLLSTLKVVFKLCFSRVWAIPLES